MEDNSNNNAIPLPFPLGNNGIRIENIVFFLKVILLFNFTLFFLQILRVFYFLINHALWDSFHKSSIIRLFKDTLAKYKSSDFNTKANTGKYGL